MKVAVFAGTYVDTKMGSDLLEKNNFETILYPISKKSQRTVEATVLFSRRTHKYRKRKD